MDNRKLCITSKSIVHLPEANPGGSGSPHFDLNIVDTEDAPAGVIMGFICTEEDANELVRRWNAYQELIGMMSRVSTLLTQMQSRSDDNPSKMNKSEYDNLCSIVTDFEQLNIK